MNCPACAAELKRVEYHAVGVDVCPECRGIWFDKGEVEPYIRQLVQDRPDIPSDPLRAPGTRSSSGGVQSPGRTCPRCGDPMSAFNYAYDSGIFLDRCLECSGVWADGGEVLRLAIHTKGNPKEARMGASMATHIQRQEEFKEMIEGGRDLTHMGPGLFFLPRIILPLKDDLERRSFPSTTIALILTNLLVFVLMATRVSDVEAFVGEFALVPSVVFHGTNLWTPLTSIFLHASLFHIIGNMLFLWIFGDNVEDALGHVCYLPFYLLCGLGGSFLHMALYPSSSVPCLGASGAIAGVMAAYFVLYPSARIRTFVFGTIIPVPAVIYLGFWFLMNLVSGAFALGTAATTGTGWFAHIGGFLMGGTIALLLRLSGRLDLGKESRE